MIPDLHGWIEAGKHTLDVIAGCVTLGALFGFLPIVSTVLTVIYLALRVYETCLRIRREHKGR